MQKANEKLKTKLSSVYFIKGQIEAVNFVIWAPDKRY